MKCIVSVLCLLLWHYCGFGCGCRNCGPARLVHVCSESFAVVGCACVRDFGVESPVAYHIAIPSVCSNARVSASSSPRRKASSSCSKLHAMSSDLAICSTVSSAGGASLSPSPTCAVGAGGGGRSAILNLPAAPVAACGRLRLCVSKSDRASA